MLFRSLALVGKLSWLLIPEKFSDKGKLKVMKDFLQWILTDGQKMAASLQYAPLPPEIVAKEHEALTSIQPVRP